MTTPEQPLSAAVPSPATAWRISFADALVALGGLIIFFFSFAPFVDNSVTILGQRIGASQNAWGFYSPLVLFIVLAGVILIATAAIDVLWPRERQIVGLHRHHVQVGVALYAFINMLGWVLNGGLSWGAAFLFIGSAIAAAGAILNHFSILQGTVPLPMPTPRTSAPSAPAGYVPPQASSVTDSSDTQVPPGS